ncbi:MAG TPA: DUF1207 domain-containing protein, partial [Elusimicrobiota bacterium]|nr:DUF1207 domain-containing protein [Elusimicrobiota bacterium]
DRQRGSNTGMRPTFCRARRFGRLVLALACAAPASAELDHPTPAGFLADAHDVFPSLVADPRELQFALRLAMPVQHTAKGEISAGDYFGLYRWQLPWEDSYLQWSIGGNVTGRFDLVDETKDNEVDDFDASMPIDVRVGRWSTRILPYHVSSHLGDDYIKRTGILPQKYSFDSFKWFVAYEPLRALRLYAGYHFVIRNETTNLGHYALQGGVEWRSGWWGDQHAQTYWATDVQSWERVAWNPSVTSQLGVRLAHDSTQRQAVCPFVEFSSGHMTPGQFFNREETRWVLGLRFELP